MSNFSTSWILQLIDNISSPMNSINEAVDGAREGVDQLDKSVRDFSAIDLHAISQSVQDLSRMLNEASAPGIAFDSQLREVQAITGLAGEGLDKLGNSARRNAKIFGGDAAAMLDSYKGVIARFGPDIAQSDEAMSMMGTNVATLSKLMGNDAVGSMDALTTAMLQFGVDLSDPIAAAKEMERMMNVMAAAGNEGASEVDMTSDALKNAGTQAKNANVSFEETNAALQILAQGGVTGAEAGVKLRNVLSKMAGIDVIPKEAAEKLAALGVDYDIVSDKTIPFTDRLRELKKAQGDATIMAQIFGIQNDAAAQILLSNVDAQDELVDKITGTNAAVEGANIIMDSFAERANRRKAFISDFGISIFDVTQNILPFVDGLGSAVMVLANLANAQKGITLLFTTLKTMPVVGKIVSGAFNIMSLGAKGFGVAIMNIPILGWIAAIIAAIIALGVHLWNTSAEFRGILTGVWEAVKIVFTGIGKFLWEVFEGIWHLIKGVFNPASWFDDNYRFSDGFDKIRNAAAEYGERIGKAFQEGKQKGIDSFNAGKGEAEVQTIQSPMTITAADLLTDDGRNGVVTPSGGNKNEKVNQKGLSLSGNGSGSGGKSITMNVTMNNYFNGKSGDEAQKIVRQLHDRLSDSLSAI